MKKYTLVDIDGNEMQYARKDAAIAAGERLGVEFIVKSPAGAVVHGVAIDFKPIKPAKAKAKADPANEAYVKAQATGVVGNPVAYTNEDGAKRFFPAMGQGAVVLAESMGLTATLDTTNRVVLVQGSKADFRKFEKAVRIRWNTAWLAFKGWKADNKAHRAEQWKTNDGKRAMYAEESEFLTAAVATGLL